MHCFRLRLSYLIFHIFCQILVKVSGLNLKGPYIRKRKRKLLSRVHLLDHEVDVLKLGSFMSQSGSMQGLKNVQMHISNLLFCWYKHVAFCRSQSPSSSLLKLCIVVIQKICYHGNMTFTLLLSIKSTWIFLLSCLCH